MSSNSTEALTSSEKKKLRDRRAQKTLREKRERYLKSLQEKVAICKEQHGSQRMQDVLRGMQKLREENERLRARQRQLRDLVNSWDLSGELGELGELGGGGGGGGEECQDLMHSPSLTPSDSLAPVVESDVLHEANIDLQLPSIHSFATPNATLGRSATRRVPTISAEEAAHPDIPSCLLDPALSDPIRRPLITPPSTETSPMISTRGATTSCDLALATTSYLLSPPQPALSPGALPIGPEWGVVPAEDQSQDCRLRGAACYWLKHPELVVACPPEPSALDLLHGSADNFLANAIYLSLRAWRCQDPERLAIGWVVYVYAKWRVSPSPESFARLPSFLSVVKGQVRRPHTSCLDHIVWPQMRVNMIERLTSDRIPDVVGILSCCIKVRWTWGSEILERDPQNQLIVRRSFYDTFMGEDGWGLTADFIERFPELVEGMDIASLVYDIL